LAQFDDLAGLRVLGDHAAELGALGIPVLASGS
jgi:hypothetical protein